MVIRVYDFILFWTNVTVEYKNPSYPNNLINDCTTRSTPNCRPNDVAGKFSNRKLQN